MPPSRLTLCLPGALAASGDTGPLARLLTDARSARVEPDGLAGALARRLGIARQHDWPIAPIALEHAGVAAGTRYWLRATPVSLEVGHEDVRLGARVRGLDAAATETLIALLNRHFAADALQFVAPTPDDWFVGLPAVPELVTQPLDGLLGARVRPHLPHGRDAAVWLRWLQEIEMLLHAHAGTQATDAVLPNAVWLQHGGTLPPRGSARRMHVWSDDPDAEALARHAGADVHELPARLADVLDASSDEESIVVAQRNGAAFTAELASLLSARRGVEVELMADRRGTPLLVWTLGQARWWQRMRRAPALPLDQLIARVPGARG